MQVFNLGVGAYIVSCLLMVVNKADSAVLEFRSKVSEVQGYMKTKASATSCLRQCMPARETETIYCSRPLQRPAGEALLTVFRHAMQNIPSDLRNLAIQHLQTSEELAHHTDSPLQHCPPYIRNHVLIHLYRKKLLRVSMLHVSTAMNHPHSAGHPVFYHLDLCTAKYERLSQGVSEEFIDAIICHSEALMSIFQPKTLVARAGERAYNWYVIISGNLEVLDNAGNLVRRHSKGSTLGDKGIIGIPQVLSCSLPCFSHTHRHNLVYPSPYLFFLVWWHTAPALTAKFHRLC